MLGIAREICANEIGALVIASDILNATTDCTHARRYPCGKWGGGVPKYRDRTSGNDGLGAAS